MSRYWSLDECCWVEYTGSSTATSAPVQASGVEQQVDVSEQIPEQPAAAPQRAPSLL